MAFRVSNIKCYVCKTCTPDKYKIGGKYYCADHYEKEREKIEHKRFQEGRKKIGKLFR